MATELDTRLWLKDNSNPKSIFLTLISIISKSKDCANNWQNLSIRKNAPGNKVLDIKGKLQLDQLPTLINEFETTDLKFTVYVSMETWRFSGLTPSKEHLMLAVSAWGTAYGAGFGFDIQQEGNAQLSYLAAGPFCAIIEDTADEKIKKVNNCVAENIENFLTLIFATTNALQPKMIKSFSDAGDFHLMNAHLAYYDKKATILEDIHQFYTLLQEGNSTYQIKKIAALDPENNSFYFHEWRPENLRKKLYESLKRMASSNLQLTERDVQSALDTGKFDFFDKEESLLILDYPFFANAFLSDFFLETIETVAELK